MLDPTFILEAEEYTLFQQIRFDVLNINDPSLFRHNGEMICTLTKKLIARRGIPEIRIKYFTDAEYFVGGRGKSRRQVFENNGTRGDDILRHGNFVRYLRYFLFGPELPQSVIEAFKEKVEECGDVTSGDVIALGDFARQLARPISPEPSTTAEEFYKLALEIGIWPSYAEMIMKSVKQAKPRASRLK